MQWINFILTFFIFWGLSQILDYYILLIVVFAFFLVGTLNQRKTQVIYKFVSFLGGYPTPTDRTLIVFTFLFISSVCYAEFRSYILEDRFYEPIPYWLRLLRIFNLTLGFRLGVWFNARTQRVFRRLFRKR